MKSTFEPLTQKSNILRFEIQKVNGCIRMGIMTLKIDIRGCRWTVLWSEFCITAACHQDVFDCVEAISVTLSLSLSLSIYLSISLSLSLRACVRAYLCAVSWYVHISTLVITGETHPINIREVSFQLSHWNAEVTIENGRMAFPVNIQGVAEIAGLPNKDITAKIVDDSHPPDIELTTEFSTQPVELDIQVLQLTDDEK